MLPEAGESGATIPGPRRKISRSRRLQGGLNLLTDLRPARKVLDSTLASRQRADAAPLSDSPVEQPLTGQLFTHYFLTEGIRETPEWRESVRAREALAGFQTEAARRFASFSRFSNPNEAVTEEKLIRPLLRLLGAGIGAITGEQPHSPRQNLARAHARRHETGWQR